MKGGKALGEKNLNCKMGASCNAEKAALETEFRLLIKELELFHRIIPTVEEPIRSLSTFATGILRVRVLAYQLGQILWFSSWFVTEVHVWKNVHIYITLSVGTKKN